MQGVIDAAFEAARVLIAVNALGRGMLAPGRPAWRLVRSAIGRRGILYRLAMTFAAIWARRAVWSSLRPTPPPPR